MTMLLASLFLSFRGARSVNPESRDSGSGPSDHPGMTMPVGTAGHFPIPFFARTPLSCPQAKNVGGTMYTGTHARLRPLQPAFIMANTGEAVSYAELDARSNRLAHLF